MQYQVKTCNWFAGCLTQGRDAGQRFAAEQLRGTPTRSEDVGSDAESGYPTSPGAAHLSVSFWPRPGGVGPAPQCLTKS